MTVCRALLLAVLIVAMPLGASAQFGGAPGELPGGPWHPPVVRPSDCQELVKLREETEKNGMAIQRADERKTSAQEACKLFRTYLAAEAKLIRRLEDVGRRCGLGPESTKQVKDGHAKASQIGKELCEAAARGPGSAGPILWLWDAPRQSRRKPGQFRDYEDNCPDCGKTGDFWWTVPPPGSR